jgi:hypothetical protein
MTFATEMLAEEENFGGLSRINRELIAKAEALDSTQRVVPNMDSTELGKEVVFRADAAFAKPEIDEALEQHGDRVARGL